MRNENFTPPAIGGHDRSTYLKLTSTRNLLGRAGQLFLLFGMLSRNPEGRLCLEDGEGRVPLDMEEAVSEPDRTERSSADGLGSRRRNVYRGLYGPDRGRVHDRGDGEGAGYGAPTE